MRGAMVSLLTGAMLLSSCTTTTLTSVWSDDARPAGPLTRTLVVGVSEDLGQRRVFEEEFARRLEAQGTAARSSLALLGPEKKPTRETILAATQEADSAFDSVLVTHLVRVDRDTVYVPPTTYVRPYSSFGYYYGQVYDYVTMPGYYTEEVNVILETRIYQLPGQNLIWSARSRSFDPTSTEDMVRSLAQAVIQDLQQRGLVR